jgi:hypothetical protein
MKKITLLLTILIIGILVLNGFGVAVVVNNGIITDKFERDNLPPNKPKIDGPTNVPPGTYEYTFNATDPDGDEVYYYVDWGDNTTTDWFGPYASGEEVALNHTFTKKMYYIIRARAKDVKEAIGDWGEISIRISVNIQITTPFFLQFLKLFIEHFPMLERIFLFYDPFINR